MLTPEPSLSHGSTANGTSPIVSAGECSGGPTSGDRHDLPMKQKALARLEAPDTKMRLFRAPDSLMRFLQTL